MTKALKLLLTFLILYFYFIHWYGWNEESHFALTLAMVHEARFEIDSWANQTGDRSRLGGHYYSDKHPGLAMLASPIYAGWKWLYSLFPQQFKAAHAPDGRYATEFQYRLPIVTPMDRGFFEFSAMIGLTFFTSSLPSALTAVVLYKLAGHFTKKRKAQLFAALVYGLATLAFPHALHFWHHPISTFLIFLSFYLIFLCRYKPRLYHFVLAGTLCGFAATTDAFATVFLPFLLIYSLGMDRRLGSAFFFASLVGSLPLLLYNQAVLGQPFGSVSAYIDRQIYRRAYPLLRSSFEALWTQAMRYLHLEKLPNPYVMLRILVYPYRGLFFYSPILLLGLCGLVLMRKSRKREVLLTIAVLLTLLAVISMRRNWWGGYAFGHRYLLPMVPFLALFLVPVAERLNSKWILPLFALGIFVNLLGLQPAEDWAYDWNRMDMRADWHARQNSFGALANPLLDHYWPRFLRDGPRSALFENLSNGYISIDPRFPPLARGAAFPFNAFFVPFLCLVPLICMLSILWYKEVASWISGVLH